MGAIHRWQDEWQSVDVARLSVDEARERLDIVRERLHEGVSYVGQEADAEHIHELEAKVLAEADAGQIRQELHAARDRAASTDDPTVKTAEEQWASRLSPTFLRRADTAELASELSSPAGGGSDRAWRETVERAMRDHRLVDQIADDALNELRRWDVLAGSQADGAHLRKLAAAAEQLRGPDGLAQFLSRLKSVDHRFHSHQLEHFSATIRREAATELAEKMKRHDVEVGPARPIESYFESFGGDVEEGQVRDDLAVIRDVLVARVEGLVEAVEHGVKHPLEAAEEAIDAARDLPGDVVDAIRDLPEAPDRLEAWWTSFVQADRKDQVRMLAEATVDAEVEILIDRVVGVAARKLVDAVIPGGPDVPKGGPVVAAPDPNAGAPAAAATAPSPDGPQPSAASSPAVKPVQSPASEPAVPDSPAPDPVRDGAGTPATAAQTDAPDLQPADPAHGAEGTVTPASQSATKQEAAGPSGARTDQPPTPTQPPTGGSVWVNTESNKYHREGSSQWEKQEQNPDRREHWVKMSETDAHADPELAPARTGNPQAERALGEQRVTEFLDSYLNGERERSFGAAAVPSAIHREVPLYSKVTVDGKDYFVLSDPKRTLDVVDLTEPTKPKVFEIGTQTPSASEVARKEAQLYVWEGEGEARVPRSEGGDGKVWGKLPNGQFVDLTGADYVIPPDVRHLPTDPADPNPNPTQTPTSPAATPSGDPAQQTTPQESSPPSSTPNAEQPGATSRAQPQSPATAPQPQASNSTAQPSTQDAQSAPTSSAAQPAPAAAATPHPSQEVSHPPDNQHKPGRGVLLAPEDPPTPTGQPATGESASDKTGAPSATGTPSAKTEAPSPTPASSVQVVRDVKTELDAVEDYDITGHFDMAKDSGATSSTAAAESTPGPSAPPPEASPTASATAASSAGAGLDEAQLASLTGDPSGAVPLASTESGIDGDTGPAAETTASEPADPGGDAQTSESESAAAEENFEAGSPESQESATSASETDTGDPQEPSAAEAGSAESPQAQETSPPTSGAQGAPASSDDPGADTGEAAHPDREQEVQPTDQHPIPFEDEKSEPGEEREEGSAIDTHPIPSEDSNSEAGGSPEGDPSADQQQQQQEQQRQREQQEQQQQEREQQQLLRQQERVEQVEEVEEVEEVEVEGEGGG